MRIGAEVQALPRGVLTPADGNPTEPASARLIFAEALGPGPACTRFKIFGERHTATKALRRLVETNSTAVLLPSAPSELAHFGQDRVDAARLLPLAEREAQFDHAFRLAGPLHAWKHGLGAFAEPEAWRPYLVLLTFRHPASWLLAMLRKPYHALVPVPRTLAEFIEMVWQPVERDGLGPGRLPLLELYNRKARAALRFAEQLRALGSPCAVVRQEDFVADQEWCFHRVRGRLPGVSEHVVPVEQSTKEAGLDRHHYRDRYGRLAWLDEIDSRSAALIDAAVDWHALAALGYAPVGTMKGRR
jgi:hypothetical protein